MMFWLWSITPVLFAISVLVIFVSVVVSLFTHFSQKRLDEKKIDAFNRYCEGVGKFSDSVKNLKVDTVEFNSLKRWMSGTIEQLQQHGEKLDLFSANAIDPEIINKLRDMVQIQGSEGNYGHNGYMRGMYNGMELMLATIEGRDPQYKTLGGTKNE